MRNKEKMATLNIREYAEVICSLKDKTTEEIADFLQQECNVFTTDEKMFVKILRKYTNVQYLCNPQGTELHLFEKAPSDIIKREKGWSWSGKPGELFIIPHCLLFKGIDHPMSVAMEAFDE